jgi:hypothetical protein
VSLVKLYGALGSNPQEGRDYFLAGAWDVALHVSVPHLDAQSAAVPT